MLTKKFTRMSDLMGDIHPCAPPSACLAPGRQQSVLRRMTVTCCWLITRPRDDTAGCWQFELFSAVLELRGHLGVGWERVELLHSGHTAVVQWYRLKQSYSSQVGKVWTRIKTGPWLRDRRVVCYAVNDADVDRSFAKFGTLRKLNIEIVAQYQRDTDTTRSRAWLQRATIALYHKFAMSCAKKHITFRNFGWILTMTLVSLTYSPNFPIFCRAEAQTWPPTHPLRDRRLCYSQNADNRRRL